MPKQETVTIAGATYKAPYALGDNALVAFDQATGKTEYKHVFIDQFSHLGVDALKTLPNCYLYLPTENLLATARGFANLLYPHKSIQTLRICEDRKPVMTMDMYHIREAAKHHEGRGAILAEQKSIEQQCVIIYYLLPHPEGKRVKKSDYQNAMVLPGGKEGERRYEEPLYHDVIYQFRRPEEITLDEIENPEFKILGAWDKGLKLDSNTPTVPYRIQVNGMNCCNCSTMTHKHWIGWACYNCGAKVMEDGWTLRDAGSRYHSCPVSYNHHIGSTCSFCGMKD